MASPTRWTWVWVNSRSWWWTGRPGMLQFMGSQRVIHNWTTELDWTEDSIIKTVWGSFKIFIAIISRTTGYLVVTMFFWKDKQINIDTGLLALSWFHFSGGEMRFLWKLLQVMHNNEFWLRLSECVFYFFVFLSTRDKDKDERKGWILINTIFC